MPRQAKGGEVDESRGGGCCAAWPEWRPSFIWGVVDAAYG